MLCKVLARLVGWIEEIRVVVQSIDTHGIGGVDPIIGFRRDEIQGDQHVHMLADFRDPWTFIDFYDKLRLNPFSDSLHHRMEGEVLNSAGALVTVSWSWAEQFKKLCNREVNVITNGFDEEDFPNETIEPDKKFSLHHFGSMNGDRNPHILWDVLSELSGQDNDFRNDLEICFTGKTDYTVIESLNKLQLMKNSRFDDYVKHSEAVRKMRSSQILLLPLNDTPNISGIIPGKIFEYLAAHRPILLIGDENGDSSIILNSCKAGLTCNFRDKDKLKNIILSYYRHYKNDALEIKSESILQFTRKGNAEKMAELLNEIC